MKIRRLLAALRTPAVLAGAGASRAGALVLAYHDVRPRAEQTVEYEVTPEDFERQLRLAQARGLRFVRAGELVTALAEGRSVDGLAAVTFDDALAGVYEHALPVLSRLGIPAAVFSTTERPGAIPGWWPQANRTLAPEELRGLAEHDVEVGSHSRSHRSLIGLAPASLEFELERSRAELEDLVGRTVDLLAYPYGHHDAQVRSAAAAAGYRGAFTFVNGRVVRSTDPLRLPRLTMGPHHNRLRYAFHLARGASAWPETQQDAP